MNSPVKKPFYNHLSEIYSIIKTIKQTVFIVEYSNPLFPDVRVAILKIFINKPEDFEKERQSTIDISMISNTFIKLYGYFSEIIIPNENHIPDYISGLFLEYCEHGDIKNNPLTNLNAEELLTHYKTLARALKIAHKHKRVHRDI